MKYTLEGTHQVVMRSPYFHQSPRYLHQTVGKFITLQFSAEGYTLTHPPSSIPEWKPGLEEVHSCIGAFYLTYLLLEESIIEPLRGQI